ncbi:hypothetical protein BRARA_H02509 [Brassica rapa]|uniref:Uncharacterized protein n=1 Tax=Brassica campestris TaxID=3711 RepID=A0A397YEI5_BRACM|nr:hypothetical protein BRARA_H02509 [Brassica rapa]
MDDEIPSLSHITWTPTLTHVFIHCVCGSEITATITRSGQAYVHIQGSPIRPVVGSILEGSSFQAFVQHCNCTVDMLFDGTSGVVYVGRDDDD